MGVRVMLLYMINDSELAPLETMSQQCTLIELAHQQSCVCRTRVSVVVGSSMW